MAVYSSLSVDCPVIWGHRYGCLFFFVRGLSRHLGTPVWLFILLCPWIVPSSGDTGMTVYSSLSVDCSVIWGHRYDCLFFFVRGLSRHLGTPVWLFILLCAWLVPSSGDTGTAVYSSLSVACPVIWGHRYGCLFFFVRGLSRHLGTPVWLFILLCPWLVPSSEDTGMTVYSSLSVDCSVIWGHRYGCLFFFVLGLSRHLGTPVWLFILLCPWIVPSSGDTGMAVYSSLSVDCPAIWGHRYGCLFFFVRGLSRHLGTPV